MAKKFAGFTPEQMGKIIPEMQGMQADEQAAYLASQPGAAARVGKMAEVAQKRIGMAYGGMATKKGYALGGIAPGSDTLQNALITANGTSMNPGLFELPMSDTYKVQDTSLNQLARDNSPFL